MSEAKLCPLFVATPQTFHKQDEQCLKEKCAWWVLRDDCCAFVSIALEISDRGHDIMNTLER